MTTAEPTARAPSPDLPGTVRVGATGLVASRLGLGTHGLHRAWSARRRQDVLAQAWDLGVRYFDTAPSYGAGLAEREIGRFAAGRRGQLVLTTKFGIAPSRLAASVPGWLYAAKAAGLVARRLRRGARTARTPVTDFDPRLLRASVEQSLRRLATERVEILFLHEPSLHAVADPEGLVRELQALRSAGKIAHVGLSGNATHCLQVAAKWTALSEVLQLEIVADDSGMPAPLAPAPPHSVYVWEFATPVADPKKGHDVLERLCSATQSGVLVLSTLDHAQLQYAQACVMRTQVSNF